jgi:outer membrane protein
MHLYGIRVFERQTNAARTVRGPHGQVFVRGVEVGGQAGHSKHSVAPLRAVAAVMLGLTAGVPSGIAQQPAATTADKQASSLPAAPAPVLTEPLKLRSSARDFSKPAGSLIGNPINTFRPTTIPKGSFVNSVRLGDLLKDGKIYLSLSDAIALALENNYDIAIARYDLDIADTDILRTRTGSSPLGAPSGLVEGTLSGSQATLSTGGGPGGTSAGSAGAGSGIGGLTLSTAGAGPVPENLEPTVTTNLQFDWATSPSSSFFTGGQSTSDTYNFGYNQGFVTGTAFQFTWDNNRSTSTNAVTTYSPGYTASFKAQVTQHLLQGAGIWVNKRFIYQALNNRRITDSSFRQQLLFTVNQVESIYWGLVQEYEDVQAKERALQQSTKLDADVKKQLEIGTMAPLDVVSADSTVATDKQALISAQSSLNYQQQIIKQAIARNLNDPALVAAAVIPTDRVSLEQIPEEQQTVDQLVQLAFQQRPELEQAVLTLRNDEITLKGARNALLPQVDIFAYLSGSGVSGTVNPKLNCAFFGGVCPPSIGGYGTALQDAFNNSSPDKGLGFNVTIPIGNKLAQSVQARSLMEYRQAELRLEQLYTQIRMQVVNSQFALTNDRAQVQAAIAARDFNNQSMEAEQKKLDLGASTASLVLAQQRTLATAEFNLIAAKALYAKDRAAFYQILASTLQHYGINLNDAATGEVKTAPAIPGLEPAKDTRVAPTTAPTSR